MADTATSKPFMITLPSGTKLYGITVTDYIKDGNNVKPVDPNKGSPVYYYTEIPRDKWKGPSDTYIRYAAPGTGSPKFYQMQGVYNRNGDGKWWIEPGYGGAELQQEFAKYNAGKPTQVSTVVATAPKAVAKAANVPESGLSATLFKTNTGGDPQKPPSGATPDTPPFDLFDKNNRIVLKDAEDVRKDYKGPDNDNRWIYPTNLGENGQDFIMFKIIQYQPRNFTLFEDDKGSLLTEREKNAPKKDILGTICLPIQPSITDSNTIDWNGNGVNPLNLGLTQFGASLMSGNANTGENVINYLQNVIKDPNTNRAITLAIAQKAASTEGLLSRVAGAIVNPNLELLFQGVQLRPFTFTFRLSPRDEKEAYRVRGIIRAFKEAMAAKTSQSSLFLKAPNVFEISYKTKNNGKEIDHPSLNKIKTCALQSCSVDYTPDGSYMTFNEPKATMTSYNLTLQFQELEPITSKDYNGIPVDEIGY